MNQRKGKMHKAALSDSEKVNYRDLVEFVDMARKDLEAEGEGDAALRFEIFGEWLRNDFKGRLKYESKIIGL
jgi:hypothetical protein